MQSVGKGKISVITGLKSVLDDLANVTHLQNRLQFFPAEDGIDPLDNDDVLRKVSSSEIVFCDGHFVQPHYHKFEKVKWIQVTFAGVDSIFNKLTKDSPKPGFLLSRMAGAYSSMMAEFVIGRIIERERHFREMYENQKAHIWFNREYKALSKCTVGILGVGDIGKKVAKACKAFDMTVYGLRSSNALPTTREQLIDKWYTRDDLHSLLKVSDYICCALPATPKTNGILSNDILEHCSEKKGVLINIGRGNIIKDSEIVKALQNGWIGGAILDVFEEEPLPQSSPLWDLPGVMISPHNSGAVSGEVLTTFLDNLALYDEGKKPKYLVDWDRMY